MSFNLFKSEEDPTLIEIHISVGKTLTKLSDFDRAQTILERGLKIALAMFISRPDHPLIAQCKMYLGLLHLEKAHNLRYEKENPKLLVISEKYLKDTLEMQEKVYTEQGKKHMTMVNTYGGLARLASMRHSKEDASEKIKLGLNMLKEILSPELLSKSMTHVKLIMIKGDIEADQGDNDNARKTFESALDMLKNIFKGTFHLTQKTK
jgi:tetratricopeptide (TPR) repeat protein